MFSGNARSITATVKWFNQQNQGPNTQQRSSELTQEEAEAALMVLRGFQCSECEAPLLKSKGFICCGFPHCPFCGHAITKKHGLIGVTGGARFERSSCHHVLLRKDGWGAGMRYWRWQFPLAGWNDKEWNQLINAVPPSLQLPRQRVKGYPQWSAAQLSAVYSSSALQLVFHIFGRDLRRSNETRTVDALRKHFIQPDLLISVLERRYGEYHFYYFAHNVVSEMKRLECFLRDLAEGTRKLREMTPQRFIVRPFLPLGSENSWRELADG